MKVLLLCFLATCLSGCGLLIANKAIWVEESVVATDQADPRACIRKGVAQVPGISIIEAESRAETAAFINFSLDTPLRFKNSDRKIAADILQYNNKTIAIRFIGPYDDMLVSREPIGPLLATITTEVAVACKNG